MIFREGFYGNNIVFGKRLRPVLVHEFDDKLYHARVLRELYDHARLHFIAPGTVIFANFNVLLTEHKRYMKIPVVCRALRNDSSLCHFFTH